MRLTTALLGAVLSMAFSFTATAADEFATYATAKENVRYKAQDAANVFKMFMRNDREAIPTSLLKNAECISVIPRVLRAGLVIGGRTGWGLTSCRTAAGWSSPAFHRLSGLNIGFQAGFERLDVVLVFTRRDAVQSLSYNRLRLGASVGLAVGPIGRKLEAGRDFSLNVPVYSYARAQGLYAGAVLEGSTMDPLENYNALLYGRISTRDILTSTHRIGVRGVEPFVQALNRYAP